MRGIRSAIVIGGGVAGCATAYHLARRGVRVRLFEQNSIAAGASAAAAGMLAPWGETGGEGPIYQAGLRALEEYPQLAAELQRLTGIDVRFRRCGILRLIRSEGAEQAPRNEAVSLARLNREELAVHGVEPAPDFTGGWYSPDEAHVDARAITEALARGAAALGAEIQDESGPISVTGTPEAGAACRAGGKLHAADAIVVAVGASSGRLLAPLGVDLPVYPVAGELLLLRPARKPTFRSIVWSGHTYIIPLPQGELLVGATSRPHDWNEAPAPESERALFEQASALLPELRGATAAGVRGGLRPASGPGYPLVGAAGGYSNLWVNSGHYRNGILLGPLTGDLLAASLCGDADAGALRRLFPAWDDRSCAVR